LASQLFDSFLVHLGCVDDPRTRESPHRIEEILFLAVCATIAGADGPSDIENFGIQQEAWLRNHIELANGIPSHDTIGRVFSMVKPMPFQEGFLSWISTFRFSEKSDGDLELVAIDGKTERGSKTSTKNALHAVSAWASHQGLTLGQVAVDAKSNEITAIPELLKMLELRGTVVTIDAMGTQKNIASAIVSDGGEYCLAVKENQPKLHAAIEGFFDQAMEENFETEGCRVHATYDRSRGRDEHRQYVIAPLPDVMSEFKKDWHNLTSIGRSLTTTTHSNGQETQEVRYFILSVEPKVRSFASYVRGHWGIESMHWILDVVFLSDKSRIHLGHSTENFGFLRRFVISLLKQDTSKGSLRGKRKKAGWNTTFLEQILENA